MSAIFDARGISMTHLMNLQKILVSCERVIGARSRAASIPRWCCAPRAMRSAIESWP